MPIREYICAVCKHRLERLEMKKKPRPMCPNCHKNMFELVSVPSPMQWGKGGR